MNQRIGDIEVLRACAVLMVAFQHLNGSLTTLDAPSLPWPMLHLGGSFGVDLFFAISGFVIARNLLPKLARQSSWSAAWPVVKVFWIRRFWRLVPSAWLWLAIILLLVWQFNDSGVFGKLGSNLDATLAGVLNYANVRFASCFGRCDFYVSFVYWSLSLEEQFYLLFPLLLVFVGRRALPVVLIVLVLVQMLQFRGLWLMAFRTDALLLGVLLAMASGSGLYQRLRPERLAKVPFLASLALLAGVTAMLVLGKPARGYFTFEISLVALLSLLLVWLASYDLGLFCRVRWLRAVMLWLGSRSYAIYLIHVPVYLLMRELQHRLLGNSGTSSLTYLAIALPVSWLLIAGLAELNFRFVESPLRRFGVRLTSGSRASTTPRETLPFTEPASTNS
ncbi:MULTISPECIES: acyltransferase [Pseudomonas]|jgi:peptidoglycan/LPS O-acetylase OafA/YrhL|uniref:acyltransferase family protein n=1 Tax=Pseudomonas TaxID=286 RepID=UPI0004D93F2F|nr:MULTISPECIES: acyltransferase [Pseudomonas]KES23732.1 hypothetical protein FG99_14165 [Pseudomonas sp. AAC]KWR72339.1 hypothetical protein RN02_27990 [Pseudomonas sp. PI1]MBH3433953.1 acyltransferase [Pseudomonas citronellolis]